MAAMSDAELMNVPGEADIARMDTHAPDVRRAQGTPYLNLVLTAIAGLLAVMVLQSPAGGGAGSPSAALAAQPSKQSGGSQGEQMGLISALEQRKIMIASLARIEERLSKMEAKLSSGISVKVTEMPPIRLPVEKDGAKDQGGQGGGGAGK